MVVRYLDRKTMKLIPKRLDIFYVAVLAYSFQNQNSVMAHQRHDLPIPPDVYTRNPLKICPKTVLIVEISITKHCQ